MVEIRDPIHGFIILSDVERALIDTPAYQRLKYIRQLALTYQVYPGATHARFEHGLGIMELAGRAFDSIVRNSPDEARAVFGDDEAKGRWRAVARLAGLLHDVGHPPFSHAGDALFTGAVKSHEEMTRLLICGLLAPVMQGTGAFRIDPDEVAYVASGIGTPSSEAALVCKELITGDLGVDRMDYLRRDSQMCGVSYGLFDLPRLISTLMLARTEVGPVLALEYGGLHAAEGLLTARYYMFSQVYFHDVRVVYDEHLIRFLRRRLPEGRYPDEPEKYLTWDDNRVLMLMRENAGDIDAAAILRREHYRRVEEFTPAQLGTELNFVQHIKETLAGEFAERVIVADSEKSTLSMSVGEIIVVDRDLRRQNNILSLSTTLEAFKPMRFARVYCDRDSRTDVLAALKQIPLPEPSKGGDSR